MTELSNEQKMIQTAVNKAWEDPSYMKELVASPSQAIQTATGHGLPEGTNLMIHDQTDPHTVYINIPPKPDFSNMELTDDQLEEVAGGELAVTAVVSVTLAAAALSYTIGYNSGW